MKWREVVQSPSLIHILPSKLLKAMQIHWESAQGRQPLEPDGFHWDVADPLTNLFTEHWHADSAAVRIILPTGKNVLWPEESTGRLET